MWNSPVCHYHAWIVRKSAHISSQFTYKTLSQKDRGHVLYVHFSITIPQGVEQDVACLLGHSRCEASRLFEFLNSQTSPWLVWRHERLCSSKYSNFLTFLRPFSRKWIKCTHGEEDVYVCLSLGEFHFQNYWSSIGGL
jgi:hypothetical protein